MNKLCYRIVFNKARGMCMAVQETARSRTKAPGQGAAGGSAPAAMRLPALRRLAFMVGAGLGGMVLADAALAQIVADPKAPGQQQATVLNTANGVLQVNIQTPSAAGVSRNVYSQFDVPKSGAILNNSRTNVQSQLGGWVQGNPWLTTGTARVILNEVNSSNPSHLQGYIEVAGDRAETVIANPAGIVVDGGGFINVSRATLTTGSPIIEDGRLKGYAVQRGQLLIEGAGLDASKTDYTALIARSLQINAGIWAQRLNVLAGVNQVEEAEQATVSQTGQASDAPPLFAVDVARLGGMYANQIYLVGTEAGVGVRNAGGIGASAGDLIVTANGRLENSGTMSASQQVKVNASAIENRGTLQAEGTLALTTGALVNAGQIDSRSEALIAVQGDVDNGGGHLDAVRIDLVGATLHNAQGTIVQTGSSALAINSSQTINVGGVMGQANPSLTSTDGGSANTGPDSSGAGGGTGTDTSSGAPSSNTDTPLTSNPAPVLADGQLKAQLVDNTAGLITANGELVVNTQALDNHDGHAYLTTFSVTGPVLDNTRGDMTVLRGFQAHTERFVNDQGKLLVGAAFDGSVGSFSNRQGLLQAGLLSLDVTGQMDNSGGTLRQTGSDTAVLNVGGPMVMDKGTLESAGAVKLQSGSIGGSDSTMNVSGDLSVDSGATSAVRSRWTIDGDASLHTSSLDNSGGAISVAHTLDASTESLTNIGGTITAGADALVTASAGIDNSGGAIQAARDVTLNASRAILNRGGRIEALGNNSVLDVAGAAIDNNGGRIANVGTGNTSLAADSIVNGGQIGGNGSIDISAHTLSNAAAGSISSQANLDMTASDRLDNAGEIVTGGRLRLGADAAVVANHGSLLAQAEIDILAASVDNTSGTIATAAGYGGQISLKASSLVSQSGSIQADGVAAIDIQRGVDNEAGHIAAVGQLSLNAGDRIENRNGSIETNGRMLMHGGEIGNDAGVITAAGKEDSVIEADRSIGNNGLIGVNGKLLVKVLTLDNGGAGTLSATGDIELAIADRLSNSGGTISTSGALNFDEAGATLVNSGVIAAAVGTRLNLGRVDNRAGIINTIQGAHLDLSANTLDNTGGVLQSAGSINAKVDGALRNQDGLIEALGMHATLALGAAAVDNAGGHIVNVGDGTAVVSASDHIFNSGVISGNGDVDVTASGVDNSGMLSSSARMELMVSSALNNDGTISAGAGLHLDQASAVLRNSGVIVASGPLDLTVASLDNTAGQIGTVEGSNADTLINAQHVEDLRGAIMADRDVVLSVKGDLDSRNGLVQAKRQLQLSAHGLVDVSNGSVETLSTDSAMQVRAGAVLNEGGRIVNVGSGDMRVSADNGLTNSGEIAGNGVLAIEAPTVVNKDEGSIVAGNALMLQTPVSLDNAGAISSGGSLSMDDPGSVLANHGTIVANGNMKLRAATVDNDGGTLATAGGSNASLSLLGVSLSNRGGTIVADRTMTVTVDGDLDNSQGRIDGLAAVLVSAGGKVTNDGGAIETTGDEASLALQARDVRNIGGRIVNVGHGGTMVSVTNSLDSSGLVAGNGTLDLHADSLVNEGGGVLASGGTMKTTVGTLFNNAGTMNSGAALDVAAQNADVLNSGMAIANGALSLDSSTLDNTGGQLGSAKGSGADVRIDAASISNRGGIILSDRDVSVNSGGIFDNDHGTLQASGSLQLFADGTVTNGGGVIEALDPAAHLTAHAGALDNGDGRIVNVGSGATNVAVDGKLSSQGLVAGNGSVNLSTAEFENQTAGTIAAGSTLQIEASHSVVNAGAVSAHDGLTVDASTASFGNSGQIVGGGDVVIDAASINNGGGQLVTVKDQGGNITLLAGAIGNVAGTIVADGAARIDTGEAFDNRQGMVHANTALAIDAVGGLENQSGVVEAVASDATLTLHTTSIDNSGGRIANVGIGATSIVAAGDIVNSGTLAGNGSMDLTASAVENQNSATIAAGAGLDLHVGQRLDNAGTISANGTLTLDQAAASITNNGQVAAGASISLHAASIANDGGQIGTLSGADIVLNSESTLSNRGGVIAASGNAVLNAQGPYDNSQGIVQAAGRLQVSSGGSLINAGGTLEADGAAATLDVGAASIDNTAGRIVNVGSGQTSLTSTTYIVNGGTIAGNGALTVSARALQNTHDGTIGSSLGLDLGTREQLLNAGTITSGGSLHIDQASASLVNGGRMAAGGTIDIATDTINNSGGQLYTASSSGAAINLRTGGLDNLSGIVSADGQLAVQVSGSVGNSDGTLHGGAGMTLNAGGALANGSGTVESASGTLAIQAQSLDSSGRIVNAGTDQTSIAVVEAIANSGIIAGNGAVALASRSLQNDSGAAIGSGAGLELGVGEQLANYGTLTSGGRLIFNQPGASLVNSGKMGAGGAIDIVSEKIDNSGGQLYTVSGSGADINLQSGSLNNSSGLVSADGLLNAGISADVNNNGGVLHGGTGTTVHAGGALANDGGVVESASGSLAIQAQSIDTSGRIVDAGTGQMTIASMMGIVNSGTIAGNGTLALSSQTLQNTASGAVGAGAELELGAAQQLVNAGTITSGGGLHFHQVSASLSNSGLIGAGGGVDITTATINNGGGQLYTANGSGAAIELHTGSLDNSDGLISADGLLSAEVSGNVGNDGGMLHGGAGAKMNAGGALANGSGTIESASGALTVQAQSLDSSGHIVNAGTGQTDITSTTAVVNSGTIAGNGELALSAQSLRNDSSGTIGSGSDLELDVAEQLANAGTISSGGKLHFEQAFAGLTNSGQIGAVGPIDIAASAINNGGGLLYTANDSAAAINLRTTSLDNSAGVISADGVLSADVSGSANNSGGTLHGGADTTLTVGGALANGSGIIESASGTLAIVAQSIESSGRIADAGTGQMSIASTTTIVNSGTIAGNGALVLSGSSLQNAASGAIGAGTGIELALREQLTNAGSITSGGQLLFDRVSASLSNSGSMGAGGAIAISASTIDNRGGLLYTIGNSGGGINLSATSLDNANGTVSADGFLDAQVGGDLANQGGTLHSGAGAALNVGGALANGSGTVESASGTLAIQAQSIESSGRIVNAGAGQTTIASTTGIVNSGTIAGNGALDVHALALGNQIGGQIASGGSLLLDLPQQLENAGLISSGGTLRFEQTGASFANSGQIAAGGDIHLSANSFDNSGGKISTVDGSGANILVAAAALDNRGGAIIAGGDAVLSFTGDVDNRGGTLQAGADLALTTSGSIANDGGMIETVGGASTLTISGSAIDNGSGRISNAGTGDTRLYSQTSINNGGLIVGMGNVLLSARSLSNQTGAEIASGNKLGLAITQQLSNQGKINSGGALDFEQTNASFSNSGEVLTGGDVVINARVVNNDGGQLGTASGSGASLTLTAQQLSNQGGRIVTDGDLIVNTHEVSSVGELFGGRDLSLAMDGDFVQGNGQQFHANRNLSLAVTGNITNTSTFEAAGTLTLSGVQIDNQAGASVDGGSVDLRASGNLTNAGEIDGAGLVDISAAKVSNSGGIVGGVVSIAADNLDNRGSAALIGATDWLGLGVVGTLNNVGGATLYSSGDMVIGGRDLGSAGTVNNISSTIEAAGNLAINTNTLSNVRENVQIVKVKTADETVHMTMPSWLHYGDNHNSFETSAANYVAHEVYFVNPSDILDDQVYITPDGYIIHRAVIRTHANDSAFYVGASGLYTAYGAQSRLTLSDGTRVIYYTEGHQVANPDQGAPASNAIVGADNVTNWTSTISFSNQYGNCSNDCIRLVTQPDYNDPRTTVIREFLRSLAPVKEVLEVSRDAHYVAVEDQLAPGAGASAQILSGGDMHLTVASALDNQYGDIKARGALVIDGGAPINNVGATLYRTYSFDGTWTTYDGQTEAYQQPSISEAIGSVAGVIDGEQGVIISGRSFDNINITAGTVGNIRDAINVIGSGATGASTAGAHLTAADRGDGPAAVTAAAGSGPGGMAGLHAEAGASVDATVGTRVDSSSGADGTIGMQFASGAGATGTVGGNVEGSAAGANVALARMAAAAISGSGLHAVPVAVAGVTDQLHAGDHLAGDGYANGAKTSSDVAASGAANGLATDGVAHQSGASNDAGPAGTVSMVRNGVRLGNVSVGAAPLVGQTATAIQGTGMGSATQVAPSGLFILNPDANGSYVYETRPQFANQQQWTSSDYMLSKLAMDPTVTQKRLGDGFYEQRLVREQLAELTGHASGSGASDDEVYKQLLDNGVSFAKEYSLRPGIALSAEQISHLTSDIVWMESETVTLPDGSSETVLAPKVYLAHVDKNNLQPGGALVTGNGVQINTTDSIVNTGGVIDGGNGRTLLVAGQDIVNRGGTIKGDSVALDAQRDVKNESLAVSESYDFKQNSGSYTSLSNQASITAAGTLDIVAGRDLSDLAGKISAGSATLTAGRNISFDTIKTGSTYQSQISGYTEKDSSVSQQLSQISTSGDLKMAATGDLNLTGTKVSVGIGGSGSGQLLAGGNINIAAVTDEVNTSVQNDPSSKQYDKQIHANQTVVGTDVAASGSLTVGAGLIGQGAINVSASSLTAGDALKLTASDSVNIESAQESHLSDTALTRTSSSFLKSKITQQADYVASSQAIGSTLSGKTVDISAGKDINVLGSAIAGDGDVNLAAVGSVNIGASTSTLTEQHHQQVKESGFLSENGFGFSIGTRTTTTDQTSDATTQSGQSRSMVGSIGGNLNMTAGSALKIVGSDISAGHDMTLAGTSVSITPGVDDANGKLTTKMTQDGLTLSLGGSVVNAIQTVPAMSSGAGQVSSDRLKTLAAAAAAMTVKDAAQDLATNGPSVKISLTVGHSESETTDVTTSSAHGGSVLTAGDNVAIIAGGSGKASNIDIVGSDVHAKGNVSLAADNQVNLLAAQDTDSQHSQSKSLSASVGVAAELSSGGPKYGFTASASASRGNVDGEGTAQVNSHVSAGERLTIASGGDTNLKGAVASGNQVVADIKGNLNIESLQDTATLDGKRQSVSVSGTVGAGAGFSASVSQSTVHNDYANVQEQSALRAGDGGFQVYVAGNTNLKGGVISGSEQAVKDGSNSLATGTLSFSDVQNRSSTDASGISLGVNVGKNQNGSTFSPNMAPGIGKESGNQSSVTSSGISGGALTIADQPAGQAVANLNRDVTTGKETAETLTKGWNGAQALDEVSAQMQITSAAMPRLAKEIGDYAASKVADLNQQGNAEEAAKWAEGGIYRVAAHAALGALGGGLDGAAGATAAAEAAPGMDKLQDALQDKLADAGLSNEAASVAAKLIAGGTAGALGGMVAGGAGAATALNADSNNRQLHPEEKSVAAKLAAASHGKYTEAQIEAAMRASGNSQVGESVATGMVVPLTADMTANEIYDTTGMLLTNPGDGRAFLVQQISSQVDPELAAYIRANTGGANSAYAWEPSLLGVKPPPAPVAAMDPFTPNMSGCITADCAAGLAESRHGPGEIRFVGILQAAGGGAQFTASTVVAGAGWASCAETAGFGCGVALLAGGAGLLAGADNTVTGVQTAIDAKPHPTTGGQLLQKTGLSPEAAEWTYAGLQLGSGYAGVRVGGAYGISSLPPQIDAFTKAAITEGNFYKDGSIVDIAGHFEKFENGASLLAPADVIGKFPVVGRPDGLFVSSPDYISDLLKKTGGDNDLIKKELGIEPQYWNGQLVRVDISNALDQSPRLPSGLEGGANSLFIRGGFTPLGAPEIVIDPVPTGAVTKTPVKKR